MDARLYLQMTSMTLAALADEGKSLSPDELRKLADAMWRAASPAAPVAGESTNGVVVRGGGNAPSPEPVVATIWL